MNRPDTLIELYDPTTHLYNALGVMLFRPRRVIFLIPEHSAHIYNKYKNEYKLMWQSHKCSPETTVSVLTGTSDIVKLAETIDQFCGDDTILDVEGGTPELYLAAGYVCARHPQGLTCVRVDFRDEKLTEYKYADGAMTSSLRPFTEEESANLSLSVSECIRIYGGRIVRDSYTELRGVGMSREAIISDARLLWDAVSVSVGKYWNDIVPDKFHVDSAEELTVYVKEADANVGTVKKAISALTQAELLVHEHTSGSKAYYKCKSPLVLSALRKAGEALELYTLSLALSIDGVTDARSGVCINFDDGEGSSNNEIDCIYMRDTTPVFVSCKNGHISSDELYKFYTVSKQFGGNERISILVAPNFSEGRRSENLLERAKLYDISVITDMNGRPFPEMTELLKNKTDEKKKKLRP